MEFTDSDELRRQILANPYLPEHLRERAKNDTSEYCRAEDDDDLLEIDRLAGHGLVRFHFESGNASMRMLAPKLPAGASPRIALGHGMAVPAPVVARTARGTGHTTVDEPQGQLPGQRRHRTGVRPSQGRVLPRPRIRLVRAVQGRARRLHHPLEHQTTPDTTRWTHPGGILESVHRGLSLYPNKQRPTIGVQFTTGRWPPLFFSHAVRR